MSDGTVVRGEIAGGVTPDVMSALARDSAFVEFIAGDGQLKYLAKRQIVQVEALEPLSRPTLSSRFVEADPYEMLGIPPGTSVEIAREAFRNLAKKYHPDRFSGLELPAEVVEYTTEMFRQINNAFTMIKAGTEQTRESDAA